MFRGIGGMRWRITFRDGTEIDAFAFFDRIYKIYMIFFGM